ncbi:hypothetical protein Tsubulata_035436 [Turnera subulata]|uniref:Piezo non-specific cation channel R-Ras-binding domain-containing protein n=1 Tax=Turnera subulata TaxID=218843 RepID=A0A9Q0FR74_9ROSI|nr:hypothetical protein Tsubulata_035436 [Turnera subulata]
MEGSRLRVFCCLLLPTVQLVLGISYPSWASFPFFICSSIGLVNWSLTSNFLGLFQWWRYLLMYAGGNIVLLYVYQLPIELFGIIQWFAGNLGLFKISAQSEWHQICSGISLISFYIMLSWIRCDLVEMEFIISATGGRLTEPLLPQKHSYLICESRSGARSTNFLLKGAIFRTFSVNFFTYGFPVSLLALSFWSFHFASFCAFGLLAYVGYVVYAVPSLFHLHRLNGLLLVFILLWAASTYVFNVAFNVLNKKIWKDMEIWETIGLWHYPIPGLYLLAQFCLGILIALGNLVNNSVFQYLSDDDRHTSSDDLTVEERGDTKVLIVATIAWGFRQCSRAIALVLIFLIALNPGFIHAVYMIYFLIYLLKHSISQKIHQSLILLCEAHFALMYILQLNLISKALEQKCSFTAEVLSKLGFLNRASYGDFLKISALACFCAIHNHGFEVLSSFSAIVQHTPSPPIGFSVLRAGLIKSVLLSVYTSRSKRSLDAISSHEKMIASYLNAVGQKFRSVYRSWGTYVVFLTILLAVYLVRPNFVSFGYLFFLLVWVIGRQLMGKTKRPLWLPLKVYSVAVFILIYSLSAFFSFRAGLLRLVDVSYAFGYKLEASMFKNIWECLAILVVMQLYSYERRNNQYSLDAENTREGSSFSFMKRLLILHSEKILNLALFYATISPIGLFGFIYLFGLVVCPMLPKFSRLPSKLFVVYTGLLVMFEYLFQLWGYQAGMFPGQKHSSLSLLLGLQFYEPGFLGIESGLRAKILVIVSCILRYNVFHWLGMIPYSNESGEKGEEPCSLFGSLEEALRHGTILSREIELSADASPFSGNQKEHRRNNSWPPHINDPTSFEVGGFEVRNSGTYPYACESSKENNKWNRKRIQHLRRERLQMQKTTLKVFVTFWIENMFNIFGLEINMIGLLVASFAVLNSISLLYVASLASCVLCPRRTVRKLWPIFVFLFGSVMTLEYLAIWLNMIVQKQDGPGVAKVRCNECWRSSDLHFSHCKKCWLGIIVDDPRMLISYYMVFMLACFKFRTDQLSSRLALETYRNMVNQCKIASLDDLSLKTKCLWTFMDYLRLYSYCHLLDLVLALILITGTLEFDVLHFGYLCIALLFFRMRLTVLKKKNDIFKFLRIYNFAIIVLSLAYQSPFLGDFCEGKCGIVDRISEVVGFYKYDYGFRITSRSALVEIIIFMLVSLQSYMFSSQKFDHVAEYLETEQISTLMREQEKRAAWKTAQLQQMRKSEEQKRLRNLQVEKMKSEMLNLQTQLHTISAPEKCGDKKSEGIRRRRATSVDADVVNGFLDKREMEFKKQHAGMSTESIFSFEVNGSPKSERSGSTSAVNSSKQSMDVLGDMIELKGNTVTYEFLDANAISGTKRRGKRDSLLSAARLVRDGISQVKSLGKLGVTNIVSFFNIKDEDYANDDSSDDDVYYEVENLSSGCDPTDRTFSVQSDIGQTTSDGVGSQIGMILCYMLGQMRSNNDVVCYCCFVMVFLWNFSLFSMVYPAVLFLYALCVNTGPSNMFWVIVLIYTEIFISVQYIYQIIIRNFDLTFDLSLLQELGFPAHKITTSFVISSWPLFLVYLSTLIQSAITARDTRWTISVEVNSRNRRDNFQEDVQGCKARLKRLFQSGKNVAGLLINSSSRYWRSLTQGAETPPYFVQLSLKVDLWPEDGIQPEKIKSGINRVLKIMHDRRCHKRGRNYSHCISRIRVQSIERSPENDDVALAVFEVLSASPLKECSRVEFYKSLTPAANVAYEILEAQRAGIFEKIRFPYPILSVIGGGKKDIDLYAYIFCADLSVFYLVAIFYESVMKNNSEFLEVYQLEDQFPKEFVFILMVIFFLIVLDRIIYLCSFAIGKVMFYLFNLVLFTYSVTKYAWYMDPQHRHTGKFALRAIYLTKAISLALQAIQLRFGIPHKSTLYRQFLTSSISQINFLGFRMYRALPFLYELRCVLDWSCTTTSLTMYDWLKVCTLQSKFSSLSCHCLLLETSYASREHASCSSFFSSSRNYSRELYLLGTLSSSMDDVYFTITNASHREVCHTRGFSL